MQVLFKNQAKTKPEPRVMLKCMHDGHVCVPFIAESVAQVGHQSWAPNSGSDGFESSLRMVPPVRAVNLYGDCSSHGNRLFKMLRTSLNRIRPAESAKNELKRAFGEHPRRSSACCSSAARCC